MEDICRQAGENIEGGTGNAAGAAESRGDQGGCCGDQTESRDAIAEGRSASAESRDAIAEGRSCGKGRRLRVMAVFGTRPDAAKMCPLVKTMLRRSDAIETFVCLTGQHREQLTQVIDVFGTPVHYSLDVMRPSQTLFTITTDVLSRIQAPLLEVSPDVVLVHGDTTTSFAAALACFYLKIPIAHVEAGLRTFNMGSPFPEEMNRAQIARLAALNFAPTSQNRDNLLKESVPGEIYVTGNTAIDAFATTLRDGYAFANPELRRMQVEGAFAGRRAVLVTAHRQDNIGSRHEQVFRAIRMLHDAVPDSLFVYPVHLNPKVREPARRILGGLARVALVEPLDLLDMHNLMRGCYMAMTDSGGLQEEAPYLGVPTLVFRTETERPEAVAAGTVRVVGVETQDVFDGAQKLFASKDEHARMATASNPYGDGRASDRIVERLLSWDRTRRLNAMHAAWRAGACAGR